MPSPPRPSRHTLCALLLLPGGALAAGGATPAPQPAEGAQAAQVSTWPVLAMLVDACYRLQEARLEALRASQDGSEAAAGLLAAAQAHAAQELGRLGPVLARLHQGVGMVVLPDSRTPTLSQDTPRRRKARRALAEWQFQHLPAPSGEASRSGLERMLAQVEEAVTGLTQALGEQPRAIPERLQALAAASPLGEAAVASMLHEAGQTP